MISTVKRYLIGKDVSETKLHSELFTTPEIEKQISPVRNAISLKNVASKITIKVDGSTFTVDATYDGDSILDVALKKGADLPFACKGGVCTTCRAKLLNGEVEMDANYSLDPEELEAGYILTCQSHPRTEKVFVDFDTK
jgi:ring-1,2-phenylacetyl-CoA epoxidase subunit PaaE